MAESNSAVARALSLTRRRFVPLWLAAVWPFLVLAACYLAVTIYVHGRPTPIGPFDPVAVWASLSVLGKFGILLAFVSSICLPPDLATAGVTIVAWSDLQGQEPGPWFLLSRIGRILPRIVILSLAIGFVCSIASVFFLVPGILVMTWASFVIPVLATYQATAWSAFRMGTRLAMTRFGALLALNVIMAVASLLVLLAGGVGVAFLAPVVDWPWWAGRTVCWVLFVASFSILMMARAALTVVLFMDSCQNQRVAIPTDPASPLH